MEHIPLEDQVGVVAALHHPLSRRAYELVVERGWVTRDDAAAELGVGRAVAAFHLDKLIDAGLLEARYERTSGRSGPGAGRPAKLYGCSAREVEVSFPPRRYDLASSLLAAALVRAASGQARAEEVLGAVARDTGFRIGREAAEKRGRSSCHAALLRSLAASGYRPRRRDGDIVLANCPFHSLVARHPDLVCQMNLDLLCGVVAGLDCADKLSARLQPIDGECCVRLGPA
ncbi:MAG: helix-turn-helix transcriptional regulator [Acidimicrobiales bacterium]